MIRIKLLNEKAIVPSRGSQEAAGLDLFTSEGVSIPSGQRAILRTGIAMSLPVNFVGLIWPRSKLAAKKGIAVLAGVVDSDYRGEVMISLLNTGYDTVEIRAGDKVAQMIIQMHSAGMEMKVVDELEDTKRGAEGVNSTEMRWRDIT